MNDIYAAPEADLSVAPEGNRAGGSVEDAIAGNIEISMLGSLGEAWRVLKGFKLKCHIASVLWFIVYVIAALLAIPIALLLVNLGADEATAGIISSIVQVVAISATMPMMVGIMIMGIRHLQGKPVSVGSIFSYFGYAPRVLLWYILMTLMIMIGYLLLILPGIYLTFAYMFSLPLIVEKDMSVWQALETSRKSISKFWFRFAGFMILVMLIMTVSMIPLGIPMIWTVPWVTLAWSLIYFKLFGAEADTLAD
jgi:hypothetical protein